MLSHVMLHLVVCSPPNGRRAPLPVHVRVVDKTDRAVVDQVFDAVGEGDSYTIAFDMPFGVYRLQSNVPDTTCSGDEFFTVLPRHDRNIAQTLVDAGPIAIPPSATPLLVDGTGAPSFHAAKPEFVTFDADAAACQHAVPNPLPARVTFEHDGDAYYASIYPSAAFTAGKMVVVALQVQTPDHGYQYLRLFNMVRASDRPWPTNVRIDVSQKQMDVLEGKPVDTLFCPPFNVTGAG